MYKDSRAIVAENGYQPVARKWRPQTYSHIKLISANDLMSLEVDSFLEPQDENLAGQHFDFSLFRP